MRRRLSALILSPTPVLSSLLLCACASVPFAPPRAAHSSLGCIHAAIQNRLPDDLPDAQAHCIASALIARYCSLPEATMAAWGKEFLDLLGSGDAEWRDLVADRHGRRCARSVTSDEALRQCCQDFRP